MTEDALILRVPGQGRLAGLALVSAALQPVDGRPLARPAVGSRAAVAELRTPWPCLVYDVFWLLSFGLYVPVPAPLAPPSSRGLRPGKSSPALLRRLFPPKIFRVLPCG
jgi:hypothetical protein